MKSFIKNISYTLFSILLAILFLYVAFRGKDINEIWTSLIGVNWIWFVILFLGSVVSHIIRAWRWKYLLYPIKKNIALRNTFSVTMIGYLINNIVPRLGEFVRPYALGKLEGVSKSATMGTIILERILDIVSFALVLLTVLTVYAGSFASWFPSIAQFQWILFVGVLIMFFVFIIIFLKSEIIFKFVKYFSFLLPKNLQGQTERIFNSFLTGFQAAKNPANFLMIAFTSILVWLSYIVLLYIPFYIYNFPQSDGLNFGSAAVLQIVSGLAFAMPTPSGIGSYHSFTSFILINLFKVNAEKALSYSIYTHAVGFLVTMVIGLYYFFVDKIHVADLMDKSTASEKE